MTTPAYYLGIGDDWLLPVIYTDTSGTPINLTGFAVGAELYLAWRPTVVAELTAANGGLVSIDATNGRFTFRVDKSVTVAAPADNSRSCQSPNRLQVWTNDSLGNRETIAVFPILVFDPRTVDPSIFPQHQVGTIVAGAIQGPAGPGGVVSVNGHTGPNQTITAHDVGAYTQAEVDAAVAGASRSLLTKTAVATVGGQKVVKTVAGGGVAAASSDNLADCGLVLGVTTGAAMQGAPVQIETTNEITEPSWSWTPGPVFLGLAGALTQTPPTTGFFQQIGIATSATSMLVDIQPPTIRN